MPVTINRYLSEIPNVPIEPDQPWLPPDEPEPEDEAQIYTQSSMIVRFQPSAKVTGVTILLPTSEREQIRLAFIYTPTDSALNVPLLNDDNGRIFTGFTGEMILFPNGTPYIKTLRVFHVGISTTDSGYIVKLNGCEETSKPLNSYHMERKVHNW